MRPCICSNDGTIRLITSPSTMISSGTATSRIIARPVSSRMARMVPITIVRGAAIIIVATITSRSCTCWMSLVIRVVSDGAPNCVTSRPENPTTRRNRSRRTSRPNPIASRAANHIAAAANTTCTIDTTTISPPRRQIVLRSPTSTPSSIKRAEIAGSTRFAVVCSAWNSTRNAISPRCGPRLSLQESPELHPPVLLTPCRKNSTSSAALGDGSYSIG